MKAAPWRRGQEKGQEELESTLQERNSPHHLPVLAAQHFRHPPSALHPRPKLYLGEAPSPLFSHLGSPWPWQSGTPSCYCLGPEWSWLGPRHQLPEPLPASAGIWSPVGADLTSDVRCHGLVKGWEEAWQRHGLGGRLLWRAPKPPPPRGACLGLPWSALHGQNHIHHCLVCLPFPPQPGQFSPRQLEC